MPLKAPAPQNRSRRRKFFLKHPDFPGRSKSMTLAMQLRTHMMNITFGSDPLAFIRLNESTTPEWRRKVSRNKYYRPGDSEARKECRLNQPQNFPSFNLMDM